MRPRRTWPQTGMREITPHKSASVHEYARSNLRDLLGMSVGENRAFIEVTPRGPAKSTFQSSSIPGEWSHSCVPLYQNCTKTHRIGGVGVSFEREADSPNC